ncbi:MAG: peptide deformylase [Pseudomonadota bacterium]|nr:peptide deformylase [Pseudomonadota bacterium]
MAILKIARMGHPVLHRRADPVEDPSAPEVRAIVRDMIETLDDAGGIGLAAPQVHIPKRIVIFFIPRERQIDGEGEGEKSGVELTIMINPEVEPIDEGITSDWEACLSVPNMMGAVPRFSAIRYTWQDLAGSTQTCEADGFHARAVQHECDHLDGILYPMRMEDLSLFGFAEEVNRNKDLLARPNLRLEAENT